MDVQTNENLLDLINSQGDVSVPYYEGCAFFPPFEFVFEMLGMSDLPKQRYEQHHQPGWLTWKTFSKWMSKLPAALQLRPSQLLKLSKMFGSDSRYLGLIRDSLYKDALWKPHAEWIVPVHYTFKSEICSAHWSALLEAEWQLMCKVLPAAPTQRAKLEALVNSSLMLTMGAPGSRERMRQLLACEPDPDKVLASSEFVNSRLADLATFLFRFAAWYIVDDSLAQWERAVREGKQNEVLFEALLPVRLEVGGWSNAVESCLKYFAHLCQCPADETLSSNLGRIWAEHDFAQKEFPEIASRQHSLRDWLSGEKGRPKRESVVSFATAVAYKVADVRGLPASRAQTEINGLVYRFHFAETSRHLLGEMQRKSFPEPLIEAVFYSYVEEYHKARQLLGRPMA